MLCWAGPGRRTQCRRRRPEPDSAAVIERRRAAHPRALGDDERAEVLEVLHSDRFVDESPATVWATLLDEGRYLASPATMYRLLRAAHGTVIERRRQAAHPPRSRPELAAVENAQLARRLIDDTLARHDVDPKALTIHSDRASPPRNQSLSCSPPWRSPDR